MILRSQVEKRIPLKEGETHLSPFAKKLVFRGGYLIPSEITAVKKQKNYRADSCDSYPWKVEVSRTYKDGTHNFGGTWRDNWKNNAAKTVDEELQNPLALKRATRVEKVARRIKLTAIGAAVLATGGLALAAHNNLETSELNPNNSATLPSCEEITTGTETLTPLPENISNLQNLGNNVCKLADTNYLITTQK